MVMFICLFAETDVFCLLVNSFRTHIRPAAVV